MIEQLFNDAYHASLMAREMPVILPSTNFGWLEWFGIWKLRKKCCANVLDYVEASGLECAGK